MLVFNPAKRISVADALAHPYMASLANPDDEPICDKKFEFEFENVELSKEMLQELMWEEMARYHREAFEALRKRQREGNLCIPRINIPA